MAKFEQHKEACDKLNMLWKNRVKCLFIHYACESFYDKEMQKTPRITAIAVRSFESGQTNSFSIHQAAELLDIDSKDIVNHYDEIEFELLKEFANFLDKNLDKYWIHWNMRDGNYGFQAIQHRYEILRNRFDHKKECSPDMPVISDDNKFDLALLFIHKYGAGYTKNPRIVNLMQLNHLNPKGFLPGDQEAIAFEKQEFHKLLISTLAKVSIFSTFFQKSVDNELVNNSRKSDYYDDYKTRLFDFLTKNIKGYVISIIVSNIIGAIIGAIVAKYIIH